MTNPADLKLNASDLRALPIPNAENLFKTLFCVVSLLVLFYVADYLAAALDTTTAMPLWVAVTLKWGMIALFAVAYGMLLVALAVLAHDGIHRVLFSSPFWNEFVGGALSAFVLVPFYANRQYHLTHHGYAHQPGFDPEESMHNYPLPIAATYGTLVAFSDHYRIVFANLLRFDSRGAPARACKDIAFTAFALVVFFVAIPALGIPLGVSVWPAMAGFLTVFAFRGLSDHYGVPPNKPRDTAREDVLDTDNKKWQADGARRQREIAGWVVLTPAWLEWLWSHVNYHEVHHKYPYMSHRYLPQVYRATVGQQPYLVVRGYWRSLFNQRKRPYFSSPEEVRPFLRAPTRAAVIEVARGQEHANV